MIGIGSRKDALIDFCLSNPLISSSCLRFWDALPYTGLEAITETYNTALSLVQGRNVDEPRKRGLLSERAASMLESERESPKSWTPIMEMQYRGGTYRGRCQGGLPEGKGYLIFPGGSFYDSMWQYGKRSGLGTLCYSNGVVFQGAWWDDLMHGKVDTDLGRRHAPRQDSAGEGS